MKNVARLAAALLALVIIPVGAATAAPDGTAELNPGDSYEWGASLPVGTNQNYFGLSGVGPQATCNKDPQSYCDTHLIKVSNPLSDEEIAAGVERKRRPLTVTLANFTSDLDLVVFESDAEGNRGVQLGQSASSDFAESVTASITTTAAQPVQYVIVDVVYFAHVGDYDGKAQF